MEAQVHGRFAARARVMKAMAHPTRLYIVDELGKGERCVHELTAMVGADMSTVSKHLSILKSVGIVRDEKRGSEVYYSLRMGCVLGFFDCIEAVLEGGEEVTCGADFRTRAKETARRGGKR
jgi:DNA-binding transcriptional ArsR family regulator